MMAWLTENAATVIVALIVAALIAVIIVKTVRDVRSGKSKCSCGCGCEGCALRDRCVSHKPEEK